MWPLTLGRSMENIEKCPVYFCQPGTHTKQDMKRAELKWYANFLISHSNKPDQSDTDWLLDSVSPAQCLAPQGSRV